MTEIRFFVAGDPAPGGSKQAFVPLHPKTKQPYRSASGRIVVNVVDDAGKRNKEWRGLVSAAAMEAMRLADSVPLTGAIEVELLFQIKRPKSHFRSNGFTLRPDAPLRHVTRPDLTKFARSTEDACTGRVWADDGQIVKQSHAKAFSDIAGCWIIVKEAE